MAEETQEQEEGTEEEVAVQEPPEPEIEDIDDTDELDEEFMKGVEDGYSDFGMLDEGEESSEKDTKDENDETEKDEKDENEGDEPEDETDEPKDDDSEDDDSQEKGFEQKLLALEKSVNDERSQSGRLRKQIADLNQQLTQLQNPSGQEEEKTPPADGQTDTPDIDQRIASMDARIEELEEYDPDQAAILRDQRDTLSLINSQNKALMEKQAELTKFVDSQKEAEQQGQMNTLVNEVESAIPGFVKEIQEDTPEFREWLGKQTMGTELVLRQSTDPNDYIEIGKKYYADRGIDKNGTTPKKTTKNTAPSQARKASAIMPVRSKRSPINKNPEQTERTFMDGVNEAIAELPESQW